MVSTPVYVDRFSEGATVLVVIVRCKRDWHAVASCEAPPTDRWVLVRPNLPSMTTTASLLYIRGLAWESYSDFHPSLEPAVYIPSQNRRAAVQLQRTLLGVAAARLRRC